jgi:hypothetical protein
MVSNHELTTIRSVSLSDNVSDNILPCDNMLSGKVLLENTDMLSNDIDTE